MKERGEKTKDHKQNIRNNIWNNYLLDIDEYISKGIDENERRFYKRGN